MRTALFLFVVALWACVAASVGTAAETPEAAWSKPVDGLSGRLRVTFEDLKPGLRHAVTLELRNESTDPLTVIDQPELEVELLDAAGKPVPTEGFPMSGPIPYPQWGVIPREATLAFRVDMRTVGVPTRAHGRALLAVGGQTWGLKAGTYTLRAKLIGERTTKSPPAAWAGRLELPPVTVTLTDTQLAPE